MSCITLYSWSLSGETSSIDPFSLFPYISPLTSHPPFQVFTQPFSIISLTLTHPTSLQMFHQYVTLPFSSQKLLSLSSYYILYPIQINLSCRFWTHINICNTKELPPLFFPFPGKRKHLSACNHFFLSTPERTNGSWQNKNTPHS